MKKMRQLTRVEFPSVSPDRGSERDIPSNDEERLLNDSLVLCQQTHGVPVAISRPVRSP
jgi:hypothetical protein